AEALNLVPLPVTARGIGRKAGTQLIRRNRVRVRYPAPGILDVNEAGIDHQMRRGGPGLSSRPGFCIRVRTEGIDAARRQYIRRIEKGSPFVLCFDVAEHQGVRAEV